MNDSLDDYKNQNYYLHIKSLMRRTNRENISYIYKIFAKFIKWDSLSLSNHTFHIYKLSIIVFSNLLNAPDLHKMLIVI